MVLGEAAIIGLLGSVVGCLVGILAAPAMLAAPDRLDVMPPRPPDHHLGVAVAGRQRGRHRGRRTGRLPTRLFVTRPDAGTIVIDGVGSRDPRWSRPGEAVLDTTMAKFLTVRAGSTVTVRFADGLSAPLRVAEVLPPDEARGSFVLSRETVRQHDPTALTDNIFMAAGQAPAHLSAGARLQNAEQLALKEYNTDAKLTDSLAMMLTVVAVGYSGLAVANSMAMAGYGRRTDFTVLRSAGGTRRQLLPFAVGETVLLVIIGSVLGLLATLPPLAGVASGVSAETATRVTMHLNGGALTWAVLGCLVMATAASALVTWNVIGVPRCPPGRRAARTKVSNS